MVRGEHPVIARLFGAHRPGLLSIDLSEFVSCSQGEERTNRTLQVKRRIPRYLSQRTTVRGPVRRGLGVERVGNRSVKVEMAGQIPGAVEINRREMLHVAARRARDNPIAQHSCVVSSRGAPFVCKSVETSVRG